MSKIRKIAWLFVVIELLLMICSNVYAVRAYQKSNTKEYKVEINRIKIRISDGESYTDIEPSDYKRVTRIDIFNPEEIYNNQYEVHQIGDALYCFEYGAGDIQGIMWAMNISFALIILVTFILFVYLDKKLIRPFTRMNSITTELSKGNLTVPIKQEKSKYFSGFLWGLDMLRDKLESDKKRELELLKEKKVMILSLSHDIKTPLSASDLYIKALKKGIYKTDEDKEKALTGVENNLAEIKDYVNQIATASRDDFISFEVENSEYYLHDLLRETGNYYEDRCRQLHIDFEMETPDNCILYGDFDRTIEVVQNAMENAIKYGDGKKISITFWEEEGCKLMTVTNTGSSLKEEELPNIFDSFYRGSNVESAPGSGLGLYICKELMHRMDGDVYAKLMEDTFALTIVIRKV